MPEPLSAESILNRAAMQEKEYDWTVAAMSYDAALKLAPESDCLKRGELHEQIGRTSFRAAFQANSAERVSISVCDCPLSLMSMLQNCCRRSALGKVCTAWLWPSIPISGQLMIPPRKELR